MHSRKWMARTCDWLYIIHCTIDGCIVHSEWVFLSEWENWLNPILSPVTSFKIEHWIDLKPYRKPDFQNVTITWKGSERMNWVWQMHKILIMQIHTHTHIFGSQKRFWIWFCLLIILKYRISNVMAN